MERLLDAGSEVGCRVPRLSLWSETKFAPYAADVFRTFATNVSTMIHALQQHIKNETRGNFISDFLEELKLLKECLSDLFVDYWLACTFLLVGTVT